MPVNSANKMELLRGLIRFSNYAGLSRLSEDSNQFVPPHSLIIFLVFHLMSLHLRSIRLSNKVERLFLAVLRGSLQFVIVVFPDHAHLLFFLSNSPMGANVNLYFLLDFHTVKNSEYDQAVHFITFPQLV